MVIHGKRTILMTVVSLFAIAFGALTIKEGGAVLFGSDASRIAAGDYVPFVLWFNFLAGFAYIIAGVGLWTKSRWAVWLSIIIALATVLIFVLFGVHVFSGGAFEKRTVIAMTLRSVVWVSIASYSWFTLKRLKA